ncbi:MAG: MATE family efflux transporter [Oscillospiraceae bacterium]|nr:MATE family efflux transporter [Oscillospiraceae bacterium]
MIPLVERVFHASHLVKDDAKLGEFPTTKEAYGGLMRIALPSVMEMVLISLIGSADSIMVGSLGPEALAAVGLTDQPRMLLMSVFFALNIGVTAIVARRKGQGDRADANRTLRNALVILTGVGIVMGIVGCLFARQFMTLAGAMPDTIDLATSYFSIVAAAVPVNALTMCISAAQRGTGNTRITLMVNLTANIVNIILNYVLIYGKFGFPCLGVVGAAIATDIGFVVGAVLALYSIAPHRKRDSFLVVHPRDDWRLNRETVRALAKIGGNSMLEQVALRVGFMMYAVIVARLGTLEFAAHQACLKFLNLTFTFGDGIGVAGTALVGQMLGQKRPDLAQMYGKISQRLAMCVSLTLLGFLIGFRRPLVSLFSDDPVVLAMAANVMIVCALIQPFQTTSVVISGCLRGAGDTKYVALVMYMCVMGIRPLLSFTAVYLLHAGLIGAWLSTLVDMAVRMTLVYRRFASGKWFTIKV